MPKSYKPKALSKDWTSLVHTIHPGYDANFKLFYDDLKRKNSDEIERLSMHRRNKYLGELPTEEFVWGLRRRPIIETGLFSYFFRDKKEKTGKILMLNYDNILRVGYEFKFNKDRTKASLAVHNFMNFPKLEKATKELGVVLAEKKKVDRMTAKIVGYKLKWTKRQKERRHIFIRELNTINTKYKLFLSKILTERSNNDVDIQFGIFDPNLTVAFPAWQFTEPDQFLMTVEFIKTYLPLRFIQYKERRGGSDQIYEPALDKIAYQMYPRVKKARKLNYSEPAYLAIAELPNSTDLAGLPNSAWEICLFLACKKEGYTYKDYLRKRFPLKNVISK